VDHVGRQEEMIIDIALRLTAVQEHKTAR